MKQFPGLIGIGAIFVLFGCGGRHAGSTGNVLAPLVPAPVSYASTSDWPLQGGDPQRNGFQHQVGWLSSSTVSSLHLAWQDTLDATIQASPVVAGGQIFVATQSGSVVALDTANGAIRWSTQLDGSIRGTPTIDGNTLVVPVYTPPSVVALNVSDGSILWNSSTSAWGAGPAVRSEPLVANQLVYVASAGGDPEGGCHPGTVVALSETSGSVVWTWTATSPGQGIGIWSPISLAPNGDVVFGTGNPCVTGIPHNEAVIALNPLTGTFDWQASTSQVGPDADIGSGVAEAGSQGFFSGKDGNLYSIDLTNGKQVWRTSMGADPGYGNIATPATDGSNVITQSGALEDPVENEVPGSVLYDYGIDGTLRWKSEKFAAEQFSSPAITSDVVVVGADHILQVRSLQSGTNLWSYDLGSFIYASPAVVQSGIYIASYGTATQGGTVAAFTLGGSQQSSIKRSLHVSAHASLRDFRPWSKQ